MVPGKPSPPHQPSGLATTEGWATKVEMQFFIYPPHFGWKTAGANKVDDTAIVNRITTDLEEPGKKLLCNIMLAIP